MTRRAGLRLAAVIAAVLLLAFATVFATAPCTEGLDGDWAAAAIHGEVIAGRALVSPYNVSTDLVTGTTVCLGAVTGGDR